WFVLVAAPTPQIYPLSLHGALPICDVRSIEPAVLRCAGQLLEWANTAEPGEYGVDIVERRTELPVYRVQPERHAGPLRALTGEDEAHLRSLASRRRNLGAGRDAIELRSQRLAVAADCCSAVVGVMPATPCRCGCDRA